MENSSCFLCGGCGYFVKVRFELGFVGRREFILFWCYGKVTIKESLLGI